ncbi:hypothetical protein C1T15_29175, partial [Escherichia coli]
GRRRYALLDLPPGAAQGAAAHHPAPAIWGPVGMVRGASLDRRPPNIGGPGWQRWSRRTMLDNG